MRVFACSTSILALIGVLAATQACRTATVNACTQSSEGYADATAVLWSSIKLLEPSEEQCASRLEILRTPGAVRRVSEEYKLGDLPVLDFQKESLLLRVGPREHFSRWVVSRGDVVTLGTQRCVALPEGSCIAEVFRLNTAAGARAAEYECPTLQCAGGVPSEPIGGVE